MFTRIMEFLVPGNSALFRKIKGNPKGNIYYNDEAENYDDNRKHHPKWDREQQIVREFLHEFPDGQCVLDVPFGTGRFVPYYLETKFSIYGLDISEDMINAARKSLGADFNNVQVDIGDATSLPYRDDAFDLVVSARFLGRIVNFGNAQKAIAEMARVTSGYALLHIGYTESKKTRRPAPDEPMKRNLSYDDLVSMLHRLGFSVEQHRITHRERKKKQAMFLLKKTQVSAAE